MPQSCATMSDASTNGLDALRQRRIVRAERKVPASRHERDPDPAQPPPNLDTSTKLQAPPLRPTSRPVTNSPITPPPAGDASSPSSPAARPADESPPAEAHHKHPHPVVGPNDPHVYLSARVRQPLEDHLCELLHQLRRAGVRSSKVELIEMMLWALPPTPDTELLGTLQAFRTAAPRDSLASALDTLDGRATA